jgi:hypothetical protein
MQIHANNKTFERNFGTFPEPFLRTQDSLSADIWTRTGQQNSTNQAHNFRRFEMDVSASVDESCVANNVRIRLDATFETIAVHRRAALDLLPFVDDPEYDTPMEFSKLKSSRRYTFINNLTITLPDGYRLCRATRPLALPGRVFWEIKFVSAKTEKSHIRIGIATVKADMEGPVGVDAFGYCVRDRGGAFHRGRQRPFPEFHPGDTIGFGVVSSGETAQMSFFINGEFQGVGFDDIPNDRWFPAVSIYRDAVVTARFMRPFKFDPGMEWRAAGELPEGRRTQLFTSKDIVKWMKVLDAGDHNKEAYKAIVEALTPAHQMPM